MLNKIILITFSVVGTLSVLSGAFLCGRATVDKKEYKPAQHISEHEVTEAIKEIGTIAVKNVKGIRIDKVDKDTNTNINNGKIRQLPYDGSEKDVVTLPAPDHIGGHIIGL